MTNNGLPSPRDPEDEAALEWVLRSGDATFDDWEGFTDWLEEDPTRADRFDRTAADLADVAAMLRKAPVSTASSTLRAAPVQLPRGRRVARYWVLGGAVAAAVAAIGGYQQHAPPAQPYVIATAAGATRVVMLADGSRVTLAGSTRLVLDRANPRVATLDRGEALFSVRHDADQPFQVTAAGERLVDLGTMFDVAVDGYGLDLAVAEGGVRVGEGRDTIDLGPGDRARIDRVGGARTVSRVRPKDVGAWTTGQLSYEGAPLGEVVGVVARALGSRILVAPAMATRPFSGTLALRALHRDPAALGPLTGGVMVRRRNGWELRAN